MEERVRDRRASYKSSSPTGAVIASITEFLVRCAAEDIEKAVRGLEAWLWSHPRWMREQILELFEKYYRKAYEESVAEVRAEYEERMRAAYDDYMRQNARQWYIRALSIARATAKFQALRMAIADIYWCYGFDFYMVDTGFRILDMSDAYRMLEEAARMATRGSRGGGDGEGGKGDVFSSPIFDENGFVKRRGGRDGEPGEARRA